MTAKEQGGHLLNTSNQIPAIESNELFTRSFVSPYLLSLVATVVDIQAPRVVTSNPTTPLHIEDNWLYFAPPTPMFLQLQNAGTLLTISICCSLCTA